MLGPASPEQALEDALVASGLHRQTARQSAAYLKSATSVVTDRDLPGRSRWGDVSPLSGKTVAHAAAAHGALPADVPIGVLEMPDARFETVAETAMGSLASRIDRLATRFPELAAKMRLAAERGARRREALGIPSPKVRLERPCRRPGSG
jgi:hypothetical protein